jgi:hypothetical protein
MLPWLFVRDRRAPLRARGAQSVYGTTGTNAILITLPAPFAVRS